MVMPTCRQSEQLVVPALPTPPSGVIVKVKAALGLNQVAELVMFATDAYRMVCVPG